MKKQIILKMLLLIILINIIIIPSISYSNEINYDSLNSAIKSKKNVSYLFSSNSEGMDLMDMTKSVFNVIRYIILAGAIIRLFLLYGEFANVGDNPQIIASIKNKAIWYILGIMFILNFWTIVKFANDIFTKVKLT